MYTKDSGKIIKETVEVHKFGKMDLFMKDIGKIIQLMVMEDLFIQTVIYILENGNMIGQMEQVNYVNNIGKYISNYGAEYVGHWKDDKQ